MRVGLFKYTLCFATTVIVLSACQGPKEIIHETQVVSPNQVQQGGIDQTGGGNGINGIPLDKFIFPVAQKNSYKLYVIPVIKKLSTVFPRLAADFYHISSNRDWYFVPAPLHEISDKILGTYAPTDQLALQDLNKIWIDRNKFDQMTEEDQGVLIVHEIMMGVRLLKYKERQDLCIAKASLIMVEADNTEAQEKFRYEKKYCRSTYPVVEGTQNTGFSLSKDDYDLIRRLVSKIIQSDIDIDIDEVKSLIETYKFRDYND